MSTAANPLVTSDLPRLSATILGATPTASQLKAVIALESQGRSAATQQYLAANIPLLVLPHPKSGIPCSGGGTLGGDIGSLATRGAALTGPAAPFVALGGQLTSIFSNLISGPSGEQTAEAPILCGGYQTMNRTFSQLDLQLQTGQIGLAEYLSDLDILQQQFNNLIAPVNPPGTDSAANRYARMVDAFVRLRKQIAPQVASAGDNISYLSRGVTSTPTGMATGSATPGFLASIAPSGGFGFSPGLVAILVIALLLFFGLGAA